MFVLLQQGATQAQKDMTEQAAQVLAQDNVELCCAFIQKTAVEKAIPEMDKRLATVRPPLCPVASGFCFKC